MQWRRDAISCCHSTARYTAHHHNTPNHRSRVQERMMAWHGRALHCMAWLVLPHVISCIALWVADAFPQLTVLKSMSSLSLLSYPTLPCPSFHSGASSVSVYINHLSQHYTTQSFHPSIHPFIHSCIYAPVLSFPSLSLTPFPLTVFSPVLLKSIFPPFPSPPFPFPFHLGDVKRSTVRVRYN
jgi:hypothetical protein